MVNKCCVPGFSSNYGSNKSGSVPCFTFPNDLTLRETWLKKIPRSNLEVTKHTVVCPKHFHDSDVIKADLLPGANGEPDIVIPRKRFKLKNGAIPSVFPNLPVYLSETKPKPRASPSKRRRRYEEAFNHEQEELLQNDKIASFSIFEEKIGNWLKQLRTVVYYCKKDYHILLYTISMANFSGPTINFCIDVNNSLEIKVWKNQVELQLTDLSWLNIQGGIYWNQLENLIHYYAGKDERCEMLKV